MSTQSIFPPPIQLQYRFHVNCFTENMEIQRRIEHVLNVLSEMLKRRGVTLSYSFNEFKDDADGIAVTILYKSPPKNISFQTEKPLLFLSLSIPELFSVKYTFKKYLEYRKRNLGPTLYMCDDLRERYAVKISAFTKISKAYIKTQTLRILAIVGEIRNVEITQYFKPKVIRVGVEELHNIGVNENEVKRVARNYLEENLVQIKVNREILEESIKLYLKVKKLAEKYNTEAILLECKEYEQSLPCLVASLLNSEGRITVCTGDLRELIFNYIIYQATARIPFTGFITSIEPENRILRIANCGMAPFQLSKDLRDIQLVNQYSWKGKGVSIKACCRRARVTICQLTLRPPTIFAVAGDSLQVQEAVLNQQYEAWPQAIIKVDENIFKVVDTLNDVKVHLITSDIRRELTYLAKILRIQTQIY